MQQLGDGKPHRIDELRQAPFSQKCIEKSLDFLLENERISLRDIFVSLVGKE